MIRCCNGEGISAGCREVRWVFFQNRVKRFDPTVAAERAPRRHHLVEHATEGEDVGALVSTRPARLLGRHVADRAEHHADLDLADFRGRLRRRWLG